MPYKPYLSYLCSLLTPMHFTFQETIKFIWFRGNDKCGTNLSHYALYSLSTSFEVLSLLLFQQTAYVAFARVKLAFDLRYHSCKLKSSYLSQWLHMIYEFNLGFIAQSIFTFHLISSNSWHEYSRVKRRNDMTVIWKYWNVQVMFNLFVSGLHAWLDELSRYKTD